MNDIRINSNRLAYFDMAKGIGILFVIMGHLQGEEFFVMSPYIIDFCIWIFSFHMPLFFIISGMLINYKKDSKKDFKIFASKHFCAIMIPYLYFSAIYLSVVLYALFIGKTIKIESLLINLWYVISTYGMSVLWFLPTLFFGELLFLFIIKRFSGKVSFLIIIIMTILSSLINFSLQQFSYNTPIMERLHEISIVLLRPILASTFIAIGYFVYHFFQERDKPSLKEIIFGFFLMLVGVILVSKNGGVDFRSLVQKNLLFYYICAVTTSIGLILICKNCKSNKILTFFGYNSLIIMAVHNNSTVLYFAYNTAMFVNKYLTRARGYICYAIILFIITVFVVLMALLINRFFPFILGKPFTLFIKQKE